MKVDRRNTASREEIGSRFNIALDRCPFCRSSDSGLRFGAAMQVVCFDCGAEGPAEDTRGDGRDAAAWRAAGKWNNRSAT